MSNNFENSDLELSFDESSYSDFSETLSSYSPSGSSKDSKTGPWSPKEDELLIHFATLHNQKDWKSVAKNFEGKTALQCSQRYKKLIKSGRNVKGPWSQEEDDKLVRWVDAQGIGKWSQASSIIKGRSGKQIRERWFNHLDPKVKTGGWSAEEDGKIFDLFQEYGTSWSKIAKFIAGRPENSIKNRFYSTLRKLVSDKKKLRNAKGKKAKALEKINNEIMEFGASNTLYRILQDQTAQNKTDVLEHQVVKVGNETLIIVSRPKLNIPEIPLEDQYICYPEEQMEEVANTHFNKAETPVEDFLNHSDDFDCSEEVLRGQAKKVKLNCEYTFENHDFSFKLPIEDKGCDEFFNSWEDNTTTVRTPTSSENFDSFGDMVAAYEKKDEFNFGDLEFEYQSFNFNPEFFVNKTKFEESF